MIALLKVATNPWSLLLQAVLALTILVAINTVSIGLFQLNLLGPQALIICALLVAALAMYNLRDYRIAAIVLSTSIITGVIVGLVVKNDESIMGYWGTKAAEAAEMVREIPERIIQPDGVHVKKPEHEILDAPAPNKLPVAAPVTTPSTAQPSGGTP